jgi:hypothetical protein
MVEIGHFYIELPALSDMNHRTSSSELEIWRIDRSKFNRLFLQLYPHKNLSCWTYTKYRATPNSIQCLREMLRIITYLTYHLCLQILRTFTP